MSQHLYTDKYGFQWRSWLCSLEDWWLKFGRDKNYLTATTLRHDQEYTDPPIICYKLRQTER